MQQREHVATIHLVRHLPSARIPHAPIDRHSLQRWCDSLDAGGIADDASVSVQLAYVVGQSHHLLVSPLARAQATAMLAVDALAPDGRPTIRTVAELRESPFPVLPVPRVRISLNAWGAICRTAWLLGYSREVESRRAAARRATRVAQRLADLSSSGTVAVIGHGFFNALVGRELRRRGWAGPRIPNGQNGGVSTYQTRMAVRRVDGST